MQLFCKTRAQSFTPKKINFGFFSQSMIPLQLPGQKLLPKTIAKKTFYVSPTFFNRVLSPKNVKKTFKKCFQINDSVLHSKINIWLSNKIILNSFQKILETPA